MKEAPVEKHLTTVVKALGGRAVKLNPLGWVGIPDRLVILPHGVVIFVELKRPKGGVVSAKQGAWYTWLSDRGHAVEVMNTKDMIDEYFKKF